MTTKLYLDIRGTTGKDKPCPIKVAINHHGSTAYISTDVKVAQKEWDKIACKVVNHPLKARLNLAISTRKVTIDRAIEDLRVSGQLKGLTLSQVRKKILLYIEPDSENHELSVSVVTRMENYAHRAKKKRTEVTYMTTVKKIRLFDVNADKLTFDDIDKDWLRRFDEFLSVTAPSANARNIHFRNLRAVFNEAIDEQITDKYPFRKFKIKPEPTKDRSLNAETLRTLFDADCEPWQKEYRDIFKLMFLLCGINLGDLALLTEIRNGRIDYKRQKTGQPVSIKVRPEAMDIINRYPGKNHLLSILDRYSDYRDYLHHLNDQLQKIGQKYDPHLKRYVGIPVCRDVTSYYARYSWATIATELDVPERVIASALGHSTASVTDIYIRTDMRKKIDVANDKVINYVLYNKM